MKLFKIKRIVYQDNSYLCLCGFSEETGNPLWDGKNNWHLHYHYEEKIALAVLKDLDTRWPLYKHLIEEI